MNKVLDRIDTMAEAVRGHVTDTDMKGIFECRM